MILILELLGYWMLAATATVLIYNLIKHTYIRSTR